MPFQKGNKLAPGGARPNSGPKSKERHEIEQTASEIAYRYIETSVKPVMHTYFQLAHGRLVNKWHDGEIVGQEFEADAATTRHFVDKLLPEVKPNEHSRPVAIQIIVEAQGHSPNGNGASAQVSGNGRRILTLGE